jgi:hypothetical protein
LTRLFEFEDEVNDDGPEFMSSVTMSWWSEEVKADIFRLA